MSNKLSLYQHSTITIDCSVYGFNNITGYTPYFTAKTKTSNSTNVLSNTGSVKDASGTLRFNLSSTDTSIVGGLYVYDIVMEQDASIYTLVKDTLEILDGVKW